MLNRLLLHSRFDFLKLDATCNAAGLCGHVAKEPQAGNMAHSRMMASQMSMVGAASMMVSRRLPPSSSFQRLPHEGRESQTHLLAWWAQL